MHPINDPSTLETIAGHPLAEGVLTVISAVAGGPLAALLPVLGNTLAATRHRERIERALSETNERLLTNEACLKLITDDQYKLLNELVLAVLHTTVPAKLTYLRSAINNTAAAVDLAPQEAVVLARIIRDISVQEIEFLKRNFHLERVQFSSIQSPNAEPRVRTIDPEAPDGLVAVGLISLGLLIPGNNTIDDSGRYRFSPLTARLLALLS